jgi:hypothetical protein
MDESKNDICERMVFELGIVKEKGDHPEKRENGKG